MHMILKIQKNDSKKKLYHKHTTPAIHNTIVMDNKKIALIIHSKFVT